MTLGLNRRGLNSERMSGQFAVWLHSLCELSSIVLTGYGYLQYREKSQVRGLVWREYGKGMAEVEADAFRCCLHSNVAGIPCRLTNCLPNKRVMHSLTDHTCCVFILDLFHSEFGWQG